MASVTEPPGKFSGHQLLDHDGTPVPADADIFVVPPAEIGDLRSVHTSLKVDQHPRSLFSRLALCFAVTVGVSVVGDLVAQYAIQKPDDRFLVRAIGWGVAPVCAGIAWYVTRFAHHASFIGTLGLYRARLKGRRENLPSAELFCFSQATEIRTGETRHFHNGVYTGTHYHYTWSNSVGKKVFILSGQYQSKAGIPKTKDEYWFGKGGELAWCEYLFQLTVDELEQQGSIHFNLTKHDFVRVGPGFMEFGMRGEVARVTPAEIAKLNLNQGTFSIKTHDAGWFSSQGKFSFSYANMANARLFLIALERLCGYRF